MICVTGATGLVGSHLIYRLLTLGKHIRAIRRKDSNLENVKKVIAYYSADYQSLFDKIEWVEADVLDLKSLNQAIVGCEYVYHAAAIVSFIHSDKSLMFNINVTGTKNIVNACLQHKVKKLCYVSSIAALGSSVNTNHVTEQSAWTNHKNISGYSISKYYAELEVWQGINRGLQAVIVNPTVILGPGNWERGSSALFLTVLKGLPFYTDGITGFVDVRDVAEIMIKLLESDITAEKFILNSENTCYKDLFARMADELGKSKPKIKVSHLMAEIAWRVEAIRCSFLHKVPLVTKETARSARNKNYYCSEKIKEAFDYKFISVADSIKHISRLLLQEKNKTEL